LGLQLSRCLGELQAKTLSVLRVEENPLYKIDRWLVLGGWGLFAIFVFRPGLLGTCTGRRRSLLILLVCVAIIIGTTLPGALKEEAKQEILSQAQTYTNQAVENGGAWVGKLAAGIRPDSLAAGGGVYRSDHLFRQCVFFRLSGGGHASP
jgi:hypothetical protein